MAYYDKDLKELVLSDEDKTIFKETGAKLMNRQFPWSKSIMKWIMPKDIQNEQRENKVSF